MSRWHVTSWISPALAIPIALACASVPAPTDAISTAEMAIRQAESAKASDLAPLNMRIAREKLDEAKGLAQKGGSDNWTKARRLAEDSLVEAQLAEQTARTEATKKYRAEAEQTVNSLRLSPDATKN